MSEIPKRPEIFEVPRPQVEVPTEKKETPSIPPGVTSDNIPPLPGKKIQWGPKKPEEVPPKERN